MSGKFEILVTERQRVGLCYAISIEMKVPLSDS